MISPQASRALAEAKWPGVKINGYGEYALCLIRKGVVISVELFPTEGAAYQTSERVPTGGWKIEQLRLPTPVPTKCRELGYE